VLDGRACLSLVLTKEGPAIFFSSTAKNAGKMPAPRKHASTLIDD
jgi:hypothetical protein